MFVSLREYIIQEVSRYIKAVLAAVRDGRIVVSNWDGRVLKMNDEVFVSTPEAWTYQRVPAAIIEVSSIAFDFTSIAEGYAKRAEDGSREFVYVANSTLEITCFGRTVPERDTLVDLLSFFFMRKDVFEYFMKRGIRIGEAVRAMSFGEETPPGQDFRIYFGALSVGINTENIVRERPPDYRIEAIVVQYSGEPHVLEIGE